MNHLLRASFTGEYPHLGFLAEAEVAVGHSFGTDVTSYGVNRQLAEHLIFHAKDSLPIVVDETLAEAFPSWGRTPDLVTGGAISTAMGGGTGTWGSWLQVRTYMQEQGYGNALIVAQAFHVGRVAMQAMRLGIQPILAPDLPKQFDADSDQLWTRSRHLWRMREAIGIPVLKLKKQL